MAKVYKPLRLHGMLLTFVIDDALLAPRPRGQCVFTVKTLVFFLSWDKCQFVPVQHGKFLGLQVASKNCRMFVPADKKLYSKGHWRLVVCWTVHQPTAGQCCCASHVSISSCEHGTHLHKKIVPVHGRERGEHC